MLVTLRLCVAARRLLLLPVAHAVYFLASSPLGLLSSHLPSYLRYLSTVQQFMLQTRTM